MVILFVGLEVVGEVRDAFTEQGDLNLGRTRIRFVLLELTDQGGFSIRCECHAVLLSLLKG